jgi:hypothetical protein
MDLQSAFDSGFAMLKSYVDGRLAELLRGDVAPDDVAEQVAKAIAIVAQPLLIPQQPPVSAPMAPPSVVNVAIPPPRKTQKQIRMRRDENNQLIADVVERDLD